MSEGKMLMNILRHLIPEDLSIWLVPVIWIDIVISIIALGGYIEPDFAKINFVLLLVYALSVLSSFFSRNKFRG